MANTTVYVIQKGKTVQEAVRVFCELKEGGIWAKTTLGLLPACDRSLLEAKGVDPAQVAKQGSAAQYPDCWLKIGLNPGGSEVMLESEYQACREISERAAKAQLHAEMAAFHAFLPEYYRRYKTAERAYEAEDVHANDVLRQWEAQRH